MSSCKNFGVFIYLPFVATKNPAGRDKIKKVGASRPFFAHNYTIKHAKIQQKIPQCGTIPGGDGIFDGIRYDKYRVFI